MRFLAWGIMAGVFLGTFFITKDLVLAFGAQFVALFLMLIFGKQFFFGDANNQDTKN